MSHGTLDQSASLRRSRPAPPSATRTMSEARQLSRRAGERVALAARSAAARQTGLGPSNQSIKMVQTLGGMPGGDCRRGLSSANGDLVTENDVLFGPGLALPSSSGYAVAGREDVWHQTRPTVVFSLCPPSLGRSASRRPLQGVRSVFGSFFKNVKFLPGAKSRAGGARTP